MLEQVWNLELYVWGSEDQEPIKAYCCPDMY